MISRAAWCGEGGDWGGGKNKKPSYTDNVLRVCIRVLDGHARQAAAAGACSHRDAAPRLSAQAAEQTSLSLCSLSSVSPGRSLTARGAAGEEVRGHLALPLHLDDTATVQLVSVADQHMVQVCGHLREDRGI